MLIALEEVTLMASTSIMLLSFKVTLSLVAQCSAVSMLSLPPKAASNCSAVRFASFFAIRMILLNKNGVSNRFDIRPKERARHQRMGYPKSVSSLTQQISYVNGFSYLCYKNSNRFDIL